MVGTALSCGALALVEAGRWPGAAACARSTLPLNALLTATIGIAMVLFEGQRDRLAAMTLDLRTRQLEHERANKMALEARLATLEARLHPHFLFNTLNAISALIREDPEEAERTVERLAALLRFSLDATQRGLVPLGDELKIVVDYLEIERTRLGERLSYALKVAPVSHRLADSPPGHPDARREQREARRRAPTRRRTRPRRGRDARRQRSWSASGTTAPASPPTR